MSYLTRSIGTVHTSAKARFTSVAIDPDRHQNLIICSLAHCQPSLKISCKSVWKFLHKVANRQTDRQTNKDNYITSLAEVIIFFQNVNNGQIITAQLKHTRSPANDKNSASV